MKIRFRSLLVAALSCVLFAPQLCLAAGHSFNHGGSSGGGNSYSPHMPSSSMSSSTPSSVTNLSGSVLRASPVTSNFNSTILKSNPIVSNGHSNVPPVNNLNNTIKPIVKNPALSNNALNHGVGNLKQGLHPQNSLKFGVGMGLGKKPMCKPSQFFCKHPWFDWWCHWGWCDPIWFDYCFDNYYLPTCLYDVECVPVEVPAVATVKIVNPPVNNAVLAFVLDSQVSQLNQGEARDFGLTGDTVIRFDRGSGMGQAAYTLQPGVYQFQRTPNGWDLLNVTNSQVAVNDLPSNP